VAHVLAVIVAHKEWSEGTDLRQGGYEEAECQCVSYDGGDDVCHQE
jgi:hypothetical protein